MSRPYAASVTRADARVDVVMVTWNTRDLTLSALEHLAAAAPGASVNLIVQDNGSTDGTAAAIAAALPDGRCRGRPDQPRFRRRREPRAAANRGAVDPAAELRRLARAGRDRPTGELCGATPARRRRRSQAAAPRRHRSSSRPGRSRRCGLRCRPRSGPAATSGRTTRNARSTGRSARRCCCAAPHSRRSGRSTNRCSCTPRTSTGAGGRTTPGGRRGSPPMRSFRHVGNASGSQRFGPKRVGRLDQQLDPGPSQALQPSRSPSAGRRSTRPARRSRRGGPAAEMTPSSRGSGGRRCDSGCGGPATIGAGEAHERALPDQPLPAACARRLRAVLPGRRTPMAGRRPSGHGGHDDDPDARRCRRRPDPQRPPGAGVVLGRPPGATTEPA